jgi:hypothetical protein
MAHPAPPPDIMNLPQTAPSTPLALIFDSPKYWRENFRPKSRSAFPSFTNRTTSNPRSGLFGYTDLSDAEGFLKASQRSIKQAAKLVDLVCNSRDPEDMRWTVKRLDRLSDLLCCVLDTAELIQNVHPDPRIVKAANQAHAALSKVLNQLNTHQGLYEVCWTNYCLGCFFWHVTTVTQGSKPATLVFKLNIHLHSLGTQTSSGSSHDWKAVVNGGEKSGSTLARRL